MLVGAVENLTLSGRQSLGPLWSYACHRVTSSSALVVAGSLVLATLSLVLIERPCIRWARRTSRRIEKAGSPNGGDDPATVEAVTPANAW